MIILLTALHIDHSALCPLRGRAAGGALLCSVKVCATNLCCLNLNSQFCCSKHLLPTGQTSPGPDQRSEDQQLTYLPAICSPTKKAIIWWLVISTVLGWNLAIARYQPRPCGQQGGKIFGKSIFFKNILVEFFSWIFLAKIYPPKIFLP